jgi:hypothetical protein
MQGVDKGSSIPPLDDRVVEIHCRPEGGATLLRAHLDIRMEDCCRKSMRDREVNDGLRPGGANEKESTKESRGDIVEVGAPRDESLACQGALKEDLP